jgi:hypothetical protein
MRVVNIPLSLGRADRVDPKVAPLGVLAVAKNLRVRKDGRLASRTGYQPLSMADSGGTTMVAYDLHEFSNGRLCAFGASQGEGHPVDVYEYTGQASNPWRFTEQSGTRRPTLTPLTLPRQVCGVPQPSQGIDAVDCASGAGYVCAIYAPSGGTLVHVQIVRESDDQVIFARKLTVENWSKARVCFAGTRFFFLGVDASSGAIELGSFVPGTSSSISVIATVVASGFTSASTLEIEAVANPTNSAVVLCYSNVGASETVTVKRYSTVGVQQGSTLTLATQVRPFNLAIEADEADNTVNLLVSQHDGSGVATSVNLRTYNFSNSLLDGPTACNTGYRATLCRLPARTGWAEHVAVVSSAISSSGDLVVEWRDQDTHASSGSTTIHNAMLATAMVSAATDGQQSGVVFGGFVGTTFDEDETNAIFYASLTTVHMATRDLRNSARNAEDFYAPLGLSLDTSTGRVAWCSVYFTGLSTESFTVTTLRLNGTERRQSASAGGLLYLAGAPVQVYDGHMATEAGFNEVPGIKSITQDTGGSLVQLATYTYVEVWEYTLPDGTFYESPPSPPVSVTLTGSNDEAVVTGYGPHSTRVAQGDGVYGAQVTGVLYRSVWDAVNNSQSSDLHEVQRFECPAAVLSDYGADIVIRDTLSDTAAATRPVLYTQGGPVEHNAPEMASYISASSARLSVAGLARTNEFQESKEQELDEAVNFSGLSSFIGRAPAPINGILSLDGIRLLFTRTDLFTVAGDGPESDASGALPQPVDLASPGGLRDWRSLLRAPDGVWFQLDDSKLYRLPRGSGTPEWLGVDVQDTLVTYPVVTGAARCRQDDTIVFACENTGSSDARIVARSLRTGIWTEDSPPLQSSQGIEALCSFGDLVAYVSGGVVYRQHPTGFADATSTVIPTVVKTHPLYPFELGGYGTMHEVLLTGEYRSAGTLALRVSVDDGVNFSTYDSFTLSGLTVGQTVQRKWALQQMDTTSVVFEWTFTPSSAGEGFIAHHAALLVDDQPRELRQLNPDEQA